MGIVGWRVITLWHAKHWQWSVTTQFRLKSLSKVLLSSSPGGGILFVHVVGPPFTLTDWFHPILLFSRISPAPWAGESGEGLDGLAPMVPQTSKPMFHNFKPSCERLFHMHVLHCTFMVPGFLESHWFQPHSCSMSVTICRSLQRLEATVFAIILSDPVFVCVCSCDWHAKKK